MAGWGLGAKPAALQVCCCFRRGSAQCGRMGPANQCAVHSAAWRSRTQGVSNDVNVAVDKHAVDKVVPMCFH